ncbi:MAG: hypothetical protein BWY40_00714 [bacterium ADurb.Bin270]|nr:MAG: hypothetical protein BWY40_00714 [bacterium ADurb.Bin270]
MLFVRSSNIPIFLPIIVMKPGGAAVESVIFDM